MLTIPKPKIIAPWNAGEAHAPMRQCHAHEVGTLADVMMSEATQSQRMAHAQPLWRHVDGRTVGEQDRSVKRMRAGSAGAPVRRPDVHGLVADARGCGAT
eukprot:scaffold14107_cov124-Isochrysis_galbana.AAC.8